MEFKYILFQHLETNKSPGPDGLHPVILKHCPTELVFAQSLITGDNPADWLMANITPVHKKDDHNIACNYHPIRH